jgi:hypothetical protein
MKWQDFGQIFYAEKYGFDYAKSPQAVVFDDYVRIYFSTCRTDGNKLVSYIKFADYTHDFSSMLRLSQHTVIEDGKLGCYDEHGIYPFSPTQTDNRLLAYISGWSRRVSVSCEVGIGIAESFDNGETFVRLGDGPILSSSLHEPFLVVDGFVRKYENQFHMWYIYGTGWSAKYAGAEPDRTYKIAHAVSNDGINWKREGRQIIPDKFESECQALPTVLKIGNKYHMYFCYRHTFDFRTNKEKSYRMGYAFSYDLINWERRDDLAGITVSEEGWDSEMVCYPNILQVQDNVYLLYNGNHFGKFGLGAAKLLSD